MRTESINSGSVTAEDVLDGLERYTRESNESDRETATKLGVNRVTLKAWLRGDDTSKMYPGAFSGFFKTRRIFVMWVKGPL